MNCSEYVTLLTFHKDRIEELASLVEMCHPYVDEIVIIDSSTEQKLKAMRLPNVYGKKVKVFWAPPLGYVEPYRMWALRKCSYEWVLYLDVDERPSHYLLEDLKYIIKIAEKRGYNGLRIMRYELFRKKDAYHKHHHTIQIRLFKKSYTKFRGVIHELPEIEGSLGSLNPTKYYILHYTGLNWKDPVPSKKFRSYFMLEVLSKPLYVQLLNESGLFAPLRKFFLKYLPKNKSVIMIIILLNAIEGLLYALRKNYNMLFDNFLDNFIIKIFPYGFRSLKSQYRYFSAFIDFIRKNKNLISDLMNLPLKDIHEQGIIKILHIYSDNDIIRISNFAKRTNKQGIDLLISLIKSQLMD